MSFNPKDKYVSSLMIPLSGKLLLVPNIAVAELTECPPAKALAGAPGWLSGMVDWRTLRVPLCNYEILNGEFFVPGRTQRLVIMNAIGTRRDHLPFYALPVQGIPSALKISTERLEKVDSPLGKIDRMCVRLGDKRAIIPDLDAIERELSQALVKTAFPLNVSSQAPATS
jgi:chemosensory pili system protein ChpC